MLANLAADFEAALAGQHQIEHHRIELGAERLATGSDAVTDQRNVEAVLLQVVAGQARNFCVVLDDQNFESRAFHDAAEPTRGAS